jgi:hypothetical protein
VDNLGFPGMARQYDANPARHAPGQRNSRRAVCGPVLHYDSDRAATSRERMTASKQGQHQMAQDPLAGDAGSTYAPLTPVPDARRAFRTGDAFALWFSLGIGLLVAQAGALLVPGRRCRMRWRPSASAA